MSDHAKLLETLEIHASAQTRRRKQFWLPKHFCYSEHDIYDDRVNKLYNHIRYSVWSFCKQTG